jgi:hypothetical protein
LDSPSAPDFARPPGELRLGHAFGVANHSERDGRRSLSRQSALAKADADEEPASTATIDNKENAHSMKHELGLLWIPAGFVFVFASVAALFLTI